jgi:hypothetical protein
LAGADDKYRSKKYREEPLIRTAGFALAGCLALSFAMTVPAAAKDLKVISDKAITGAGNAESVAYDPKEKVFYAGDFGAPASTSADKDGKGKINKISLDGKVTDSGLKPAEGQPPFNKPKGIWINRNRIWIADLDAVWVFDLKSKKGRRLEVGTGYANDVTVVRNVLYITDNRNDAVVRVTPANFLRAKVEPKIEKIYSGKGVSPNGIYPSRNGSLLLGGFKSKDDPRGIYELGLGQEPKLISKPIGMVDGIYQMRNGEILATDWVTNSLFQWNEKDGVRKLAGDVKGPADFCVVRNRDGYLVALPDLVKGEIRLIQLGR